MLKSELILQSIEQSKALQTQEPVQSADCSPLVIFSLGNAYFAFVGSHAKEIIPNDQTITPVPGFSEAIHGLINLRGDIEAVLNIHHVLDLPEPDMDKNSRIILIESNHVRCGVLVDAVKDVRDVDMSMIKPPVDTLPAAVAACASGGERLFNSRYVTLLDVDKLFHKIGIDSLDSHA